MFQINKLYELIKKAYIQDATESLKKEIHEELYKVIYGVDVWINKLKTSNINIDQEPTLTLQTKAQNIIKFKELYERLNPKWSKNHLNLMMISLERQLGTEILEHDYLVTTKDRLVKQKNKIFNISIILENMRSSFNVGSVFRTAESFGVEKIYLCGYTSTPENPKTLKTTMGTHEHIDWEHFTDTASVILELKKQGYKVYALETSKKAISLYNINSLNIQYDKPTAFLFGNERFGIHGSSLELCDNIIQIPNFGTKNSLNVSVAIGITLCEWVRLTTIK